MIRISKLAVDGNNTSALIALFGQSPSWTIAWAGRRVSRHLVERSEEETEKVESKQFIARNTSKVFHVPSCVKAQEIKQSQQIWFSNAQDAKDCGYRPCRVCQPE